MKRKRLLAIMLTLTLLVGMITPVPASAAEIDPVVDNSNYLDTTGWTVSTTKPASDLNAATAALLDDDPNTVWTSTNNQSGAYQQVIQIDMGSEQTFDTIYIECPSTTEYGREYFIEDSSNWGGTYGYTNGQSGTTKITFSPRTARQINIWQSGTENVPWSVARIRIANSTVSTQPSTTDQVVKKGVASYKYSNTDISKLAALNTGWFYNWGYECSTNYTENNQEYVPMVWGAATASDANIAELTKGQQAGLYSNLLAFNEPDLSDQANMTVEQCIELWPKLMSTGLRLGSPAPANYEWLDSFMTEANNKGYRVDFIALHFYPDFTNPDAVNDLKNTLINIYNKYQKPIWITEIGTIDINTWGIKTTQPVTQELAVKYLKDVTVMLESLKFVERYAWFDDNCYNSDAAKYSSLYDLSDNLTDMGNTYKDIISQPYLNYGSTNHIPVLSAIGKKSVTDGETLDFTVKGTDIDGDTLTYSTSELPDGCSFNQETGEFHWTPVATQWGDHSITFTVSDGKDSSSETITISVVKANPIELQEIPVTGKVYYGDFIWGDWYFIWNEDKARSLTNGTLTSQGTASALTTGQVYTHGDLVLMGFDQEVTTKKIVIKSAANGEMPYKFKLEYSKQALPSPVNIPGGTTTVGEYTGYSTTGDTITIELANPITARSIWIQALTNGENQESGKTAWSVSEIHLYQEKVSDLPDKPSNLTILDRQETSVSFSWTANNYTGFDIYRSDSPNGTYTKIGSIKDATKYIDSGLSKATTYYYKVIAINNNGVSEISDLLSITTLSVGLPSIVKGLDITEANDIITLSWEPSENAAYYEVYRATGKYSNYEPYKNTSINSFVDPVVSEKYKYYYKVCAVNSDGIRSELTDDISLEGKLFGNTMTIYSSTDNPAIINKMTAETATKMIPMATSEFSNDRYSFMFKPGEYNINQIDVGYYTSIYGLGSTPLETTIPKVEVSSWGDNSLTHFWRSVENIGIDTGSSTNEVKWAASQAAPVRRVYINGKLHLDDIGKPASGGYVADSLITGQTGSWSQQQYFLRNDKLTGGWYDGVWNMLFVGTINAPLETVDWATKAYQSYTVENETPIIREKPFLYLTNEGDYAVFVPGIRKSSSGVSWSEGNPGVGKSISIDDFYVAKSSVDTAETINAALEQGKHLLLTPGIYKVDQPIKVNNPNTVVLGIGYATIVPTNGNDAMQIADVDGVTVAGILFDAGVNGSQHLLQVGPENSDVDHSDNPTLLADVFTRVGGAVDGKAETTLEINSKNVIGDHFWLWRADHGMTETSTGWYKNTAKNGVIVNGDNVSIYGLFVEHFQEYQTLWNGDNGKTYFYQSEIPYDAPYQSDYMSHNGTVKGYASYKVSDNVKSHYVVALGIYDVFIHNLERVELDNAMEVSDGTTVKHVCTISLGGDGGTNHVINGIGDSVMNGEAKKVGINYYYVERIPVSNIASYDGVTGILTISGKNYDSNELRWNKFILKGQNGNLVLDESMIKDVTNSLYDITITLNDAAKDQIARVFGYENGTKESGINLLADYMAGGIDTVFNLDVSGLEKKVINKTDLQDLYDENRDKVQGSYSNSSWYNFMNYLNSAKTVLDNVEATQEEVDNAFQILKTAIDSLVLNKAPVLSSLGEKTVDEGLNITFIVSGTDEDNDILTYSASDLPTGSTFNTDTKTFSWTTNYKQSGVYEITFTVSDGRLTSSQSVRIIVRNVGPSELLNNLINEISNENIAVGTELGENALKSLEKGNVISAVNQLNAWTKQIKRKLNLTDQKADYLIEKIKLIISLIESNS